MKIDHEKLKKKKKKIDEMSKIGETQAKNNSIQIDKFKRSGHFAKRRIKQRRALKRNQAGAQRTIKQKGD